MPQNNCLVAFNYKMIDKVVISPSVNHSVEFSLTIIWKCFVGYIKDFQVFDPHRVGKITVELQGRINDCKALTYRQDIKAKDIEGYRLRTLPTRQVCPVLIMNVPQHPVILKP